MGEKWYYALWTGMTVVTGFYVQICDILFWMAIHLYRWGSHSVYLCLMLLNKELKIRFPIPLRPWCNMGWVQADTSTSLARVGVFFLLAWTKNCMRLAHLFWASLMIYYWACCCSFAIASRVARLLPCYAWLLLNNNLDNFCEQKLFFVYNTIIGKFTFNYEV